MKLVTFKMDKTNIRRVDGIVNQFSFESRTEFIRQAIRELVEEYETKLAVRKLAKIKGFAKGKNISKKEWETTREKAFKEIEASIK